MGEALFRKFPRKILVLWKKLHIEGKGRASCSYYEEAVKPGSAPKGPKAMVL